MSNAAEIKPEIKVVTHWTGACDGGEGALGHPRVYLTISRETGEVVCPYCGKKFVIDRAHAVDDH